MTAIKALGRAFLCGLIRVYQWGISPLLPGTCRFHPTCSAYAIEAVSGHGAIRGSWLGLRRLLRCHPWGGSGFDPVPDPSGSRASRRPPAYTDHNHA